MTFPQKKETLADVFKDFGENTTAHGVPRIAESKSIWRKIFWSLICLASWGAFCYMGGLLLIQYFSYPTNTKVKMMFEVLDFPAVTICNQNQFRQSMVSYGGRDFEATIESYYTKLKEHMMPPSRNSEGPSGGIQNGGDVLNSGDIQPLPGSDQQATQAPEQQNAEQITQQPQQQDGGQTTQISQKQGGDLATQAPQQQGAQQTTQAPQQQDSGQATQVPQLQGVVQTTQASQKQAADQTTQASQQQGGDQTTQASQQQAVDQTTQASQQQGGGQTTQASQQQAVDQTTQASQQQGGGQTTQASQQQSGDKTTQVSQQGGQETTTTPSQQGAQQTTQSQQQQTTQNQNPPPAPGKTRKKRNTNNEPRGKSDPNDATFKPTVNMTGKTWFDNPGERSATFENARNLSIVIASLTQDQKETMGHQIADMIQECQWSGRTCTPDNFTAFYSRYYGNCYTFNSVDESYTVGKVTKPGPTYGLSLTLLVEQDEYVQSISPSAGMRVLIHRKDVQPFPEEDGFDVAPGQKTSVSLRRLSITRLEHPWGNCTYGEEFELMYSRNYSVQACVRTCLQEKNLEKCGCADATLPVPTGESYCDTVATLDCLDNVENQYMNDEFTCKCPQSCVEDMYEKTISSSEWPSDSFRETLIEQYGERGDRLKRLVHSPDGPQKHLLQVQIFFEELNYQQLIEEKAYEPENLLGDIGGQLGLWLGISVITLSELLELVATCFKTLFCKPRQINNNLERRRSSFGLPPSFTNNKQKERRRNSFDLPTSARKTKSPTAWA